MVVHCSGSLVPRLAAHQKLIDGKQFPVDGEPGNEATAPIERDNNILPHC